MGRQKKKRYAHKVNWDDIDKQLQKTCSKRVPIKKSCCKDF